MLPIDKLPERIKAIREDIPMTQKEFSDLLGIKQQTLSGYETGKMKPPIDVLAMISQKCNISIDWMCGISEKRQSQREFVTGADVIQTLAELNKAVYFFVDRCRTDDGEYQAIIIPDSAIQLFLNDWKSMLNIYRNGTITESLYKLWLEEQKTEYTMYKLKDEDSLLEFLDYIGFTRPNEKEDK